MSHYQIIYLNGPSSSGKTTLALKLQQHLQRPFLRFGIDKIIGMMPDKLNDWEGADAPLGFSWKKGVDPTGHPTQEIQMGPFAKKMSETVKVVVLAMLKMGHSIIIDDVAFGKKDVDVWKKALHGYKVLWVGIHTPLEILETREKKRGDRMHGSARAQFFQVHTDVEYDLEFDTHTDSIEHISKLIEKKLSSV